MMKKLHYFLTFTTFCICFSLQAQTAFVSYDFESDTDGNTPTNITNSTGTVITSTYNGGKVLEMNDYGGGNTGSCIFNAFPDTKDYSVTWKVNYTDNGKRMGMLLRAHGETQFGAIVQQGYFFEVASHIRSDWQYLQIKKYEANGTTPPQPVLDKQNLAAPGANVTRWYRATVNGEDLTFEYSDDGDAENPTWITHIAIKDSSYKDVSGGTWLLQGLQSPVGNGYYDDIQYKNLDPAVLSNENITLKDFVISPTYANDKITVSLKASPSKINISIISLNGKVAQEYSTNKPANNSIELNISKLSTGMYILKIEADGKVATQKIVKQ